MKYFLLMCVSGAMAIAAAACLPATGDHILGSDLAAADARFLALPASGQFGYAPVAGAPRVFRASELQSIARAGGTEVTGLTDICFEVPLRVPAGKEFMDALRSSLPPESEVRVVDMTRAAIPAGKIEFSLSGLEPPSAGNDGAQLWRGFVQYSDTRRIAVWARVAIAVNYTAVVTRRDLAADTPIDPLALQLETRTGPLKREPPATRIEDIAGRVVRRSVKAGAEIPLSLVAEPPAVRRGDLVRVEVRSGRAILRFDAIAETTARAGDIADFRNPITGKTFHARAETGSRAVVIVEKGPA